MAGKETRVFAALRRWRCQGPSPCPLPVLRGRRMRARVFLRWALSHGLGAAEIVFQADDVVFAEVVAALDFDEGQLLRTGIGHAVGGTDGDVDHLPEAELVVGSVEGHQALTADDHPVFRTLSVLLIAQAL